MRVIYLVLGLFLVLACSTQVQRGPASFGLSSCKEIVGKILSKTNQYTFGALNQKLIKPAVKKLGKHSLKSRLAFLKLLNAKRGRNKFLTQMYATTINKMLSEGLITSKDVPSLLKQNNKAKFKLDFTYGEVRLIPEIWDGKPNLNETMDMILDRTQPTVEDVRRLRGMLEKSDFTPVEFEQFQKYFVRFPEDDEQWKMLEDYLLFANAMRPKNQSKALSELPMLFYPDDTGKHLKKFRSIQRSISNFEKKQIKKQTKKALKTGASSEEAARIAKIEAKKLAETYSSLKYACRSTKPTAESKQAAKSTSTFFMAMGISATAGTYAYANWDKDKTKFDWYGKLGHDLAWKFIFQYGYNAIMTDQGATFLKKMLSLHVFYTPADYIEAAMYDLEFGEENSFVVEEYERMLELRKKDDPEFVQAYNAAMSTLNTEFFQDKIKSFTRELITGEIQPPKNEYDEILSLEDITAAELEDEEIQERLMEAVALKVYTENAGQIQLGSGTIDRYIFVRSYDMLDVPKSLAVGLWIYRTMCMGGLNMKAAIIQASIIYTLDQIIGKFIYYQIRRDVINM